MCRFFDPQVPRQCLEDGAEDVTEKERQNFCDWFKPAANVFDAGRFGEAQQAKSQLAELFGDSDAASKDGDTATSEADDLFK